MEFQLHSCHYPNMINFEMTTNFRVKYLTATVHSVAIHPTAKVKELIALLIAVSTRCDGCIAFHSQAALNAGASREEIIEMLGVTVFMGGGRSLMYATHVMEAIEQFTTKS